MGGVLELSNWQWLGVGAYGVILAAVIARVVLTETTILKTPFLNARVRRWGEVELEKVSILVPARDEAANIESCLEALLLQDYQNLEILVVDDRSGDETAQIVERIAATDSRVRLVSIRTLPPGWTGKTHALHVGQYQAQGEWLLFVDADATLHPNCVTAAVRDAQSSDAGLLSLVPRLDMRSFWEQAFQPIGSMMLGVFCPILRANDNRRTDGGFANGQFLLFRRSTYDEIGGHRAVRDKFVEDVNFGRLVKAGGHGLRIALAPELISVRMYASLAQILRGWSRIFYAVADGNGKRIAAFGAVYTLLTVLPALMVPVLAALAVTGNFGTFGWILAGCAVTQELLQTFVSARVNRVFATPLAALKLRWVGIGVMLTVLWRTWRLCSTHQVEWRGTSYAGTLSQVLAAPSGQRMAA